MTGRTWSVAVLMLAAAIGITSCAGDEEPAGTGGTTPVTTTTPVADPLVGTWTADITPSMMRHAAEAAGVDGDGDPTQLFGKGDVLTFIIRFEDGHLIQSHRVDGGREEIGWDGAYEILDADTVMAGDGGNGAGNLYLEYAYEVDGDRLTMDVVKDDYPAVSEVELAGEIFAQTVIYESSPFTRET